MQKTKLDWVNDEYCDMELLSADGFDDAIIGVDESGERIVYSVRRVLEILMEADDEEDEEGYDKYTRAVEWFEFNMQGAYMGEHTPIWCHDEWMENY